MAHATVDMVVDFLDDLGSLSAQRRATAEEMEARLPGAAPAAGMPYERILEDLCDHVVPFTCVNGHPRYFAFVPGEGTCPGRSGPRRQRAQLERRLVDGGGRARAGRADRARLVQGVDRLPGGGGRGAGVRAARPPT